MIRKMVFVAATSALMIFAPMSIGAAAAADQSVAAPKTVAVSPTAERSGKASKHVAHHVKSSTHEATRHKAAIVKASAKRDVAPKDGAASADHSVMAVTQ
jgi:hypothetical protein